MCLMMFPTHLIFLHFLMIAVQVATCASQQAVTNHPNYKQRRDPPYTASHAPPIHPHIILNSTSRLPGGPFPSHAPPPHSPPPHAPPPHYPIRPSSAMRFFNLYTIAQRRAVPSTYQPMISLGQRVWYMVVTPI